MRAVVVIFVSIAISAFGGGCSTPQPTLGSNPKLSALEVTDINGRTHRPLAVDGSTQVASVLTFITTDCPIANSYAPELSSIVREYSGNGVRFFFVHVDSMVRLEQAREHARSYGLNAPVVIDHDHSIVRAVGATKTPEAAVIDRHGKLVYLGRIDDRYVDFGKKRVHPSQRDLREALDAVLAGRPVSVARTKAVGCFIPESS